MKRLLFIIALFLVRGTAAGQEQAAAEKIIVTSGFEYQAESLRDPFQTYIVNKPVSEQAGGGKAENVVAKLPELRIDALFWGARFPQAIINGKVVKEGETIEDARVTRIGKEGVTLTFANRDFTLNPPGMGQATSSQGGQE